MRASGRSTAAERPCAPSSLEGHVLGTLTQRSAARFIFYSFSCHLLSNSGVDFKVFLILVLSGAAFGVCSWCDCLGIFRDGIRWIWERTGRIIEDRQREIRKRREEKRGDDVERVESGAGPPPGCRPPFGTTRSPPPRAAAAPARWARRRPTSL